MSEILIDKINKTDKFELYSFCFYLYFFVYINDYLMEQNILKFMILNFLGNYITTYLLNFNIFTLIMHKYLKIHIKDIVIPHALTCISNIYINRWSLTTALPLQIVIHYFIIRMYNEDKISRNMRLSITILYIFAKFIFLN